MFNKGLFFMIGQPAEEMIVAASRRHGVKIEKIC